MLINFNSATYIVNTNYTDQLKKCYSYVNTNYSGHLFSSTNIQIQTILINFTSATHKVNINFDKVNKTIVTISIYMKCSHIHTLL